MIRLSSKITILYTLFAVLTTLVNIGGQMLSVFFYKNLYSIEISILIGTLVALPLRYILEKKYIFSFETKNIKHDGRLFILYSIMGLFTTAIFWVTEYIFHLIYTTNNMRYFGAMIGLAIGYCIKYQLDKKYVFVPNISKVISS